MPRPPKAPRCIVFLSFACLFLAAAGAALAVPPGNGKLQIIHLNAAQGNAAVLISPEGQVAMFDDGSSTTFCSHCPSCASVLSQLQALGITHVALHFASHYHADHIGCISALTGITIDQGWDRGGSYSSGAFTSYTTYLGAKRHTLTKGQVFTLDSLSAHPVIIKCVALAGNGISTTDENSLSVCMKVTYGEFDEEIGGDLEGVNSTSYKDIETGVGPLVGKVEVSLVHHHGAVNATNVNWLNAIQPKIGIVTAGIGNSYGHPTATVMDRLHAYGVRTYWSEIGSGAAPNPDYDKVANGPIRIVATWQPGGVDSVYAAAYADTFTNSGSAADQIAPSVTVLYPNGGETVAAGSPANVTWNATDNVGVTSVDVAYSLDNGANWSPIAAGVPNSGSYPWAVPNSTSSIALARVKAYDGAGNSTAIASASDFIIADQTAPSVTVVSPNGGESWASGSAETITWSAGDNIGVSSVDVDYSLHGGSGPWLAIQHGLANSGSTSWTPDAPASDSVLVRLTAFDAALNQSADLSDNLFQVTQSPLGVAPGQPLQFALATPGPNPSGGRVAFHFSLAAAALTRIDVLDVTGRRVWGTPPNWAEAGAHDLSWDGRDERGRAALSGLYFVRLSSGGRSLAVRFVHLN